jgi:hypothetical protein
MVFRVASSVTTSGGGTFSGYYGSFYSSLDQTDGTTPHLMFAENTADADGVSMQTGVEATKSQMTFAHAGTYNIQFSAQLHNKGGGGSGQTVNIWFKLNGNNIANSDTKIVVPSNAPYLVAAWNFIVSVAVGDYVEIAWFTDNVNIILEQENATAVSPAIPSVIMTAVQIR